DGNNGIFSGLHRLEKIIKAGLNVKGPRDEFYDSKVASSSMDAPWKSLETGQPCLAASAISWNLSSLMPGTLPFIVSLMPTILGPASVTSNLTSACVCTDSGL